MKLIKKDINLTDFARFCAIFMSVNEENFEKLKKLNSFSKIEEELFGKTNENLENIKTAQNEIISYAKEVNSYEFFAYISEAFDILQNENIISKSVSSSLKSLFVLEKKEETKSSIKPLHVKNDLTFNEKIDLLFKITNDLKENVESKTLKQKLENIEETLKNRSFSVGITGVMNAGKSTLLNALMRSNILGTAVVPETANLTVIRYANKKSATVNFWTQKNWEDIKTSAKTLPSVAKFIDDTEAIFGKNIEDFITTNGRQENIDINELPLYTSAITSKGKCNLVKSVDLYVNLPFLEDGVMIVDTPGLDDPVIQREEITKEYLSSCDLMIHLMNVAQSATQKDIEFIIDALTYQGISRLLVVLTRIDAISENELKEVINYTKLSIKKQLEKNNKGALLSSILEKLEFIPVAGKLALMHRMSEGDKALKLGFTEEKTGIFEIERYLNDVLFGEDSPKANLLILSNAKSLYISTNESLKAYKSESENLLKSTDELKYEIEKRGEENSKKEQEIDKLLLHVKTYKDELKAFSSSLLLELDQRVNSLKTKIFNRVYDDVKYELNKNKKKPTNERITYFVDSGIKDGILDLIRDYRFSFSKKSQNSQEKLFLLFEGLELESTASKFDVKEFFAMHSKNINTNFSVLITNVTELVKKTSKNTLDEFAQNLEEALKSAFVKLYEDLKVVLTSLNSNFLDEFEVKNSEPLNLTKNIMKEEIENLQKQINLISKNVEEAKRRALALHVKMENLTVIKENLENFGIKE
ncbi:MAG: dynamin family protein [Campylobacteraceae bacterium]